MRANQRTRIDQDRNLRCDPPDLEARVEEQSGLWIQEDGGAEIAHEEFNRVLAQLPENCRIALMRQRSDGLSYEEIATELGVSPNTVKDYIVRALEHFRAHFSLNSTPPVISKGSQMMSTNTDEQNPPQSQLGLEAARWLLRLRDTQPDPQDPHADLATRNEAFLDWLSTSAQHVRIFHEAYETHRRLGPLGPRQKINIDGPLRKRIADVIRIYGTPEHPATSAQLPATPPRVSRRKLIGIAAAAVTVAIGVSLLALNPFGSQTYSTRVGEQRTCKLDDGSMVYLNTDSRLEVDFSDRVRNIRLVRGEALFVVARNTHRPFIVTSNTAAVRAIGTRFNVRTRADATDVVVVEGVVQVTATGVNPAGSAESTPLPAVQLAPHQARSASPPCGSNAGKLHAPRRWRRGTRHARTSQR